MSPSSYTLAENWGFQVNFMVPLDQRGLEQCRSIAARQQAKMELDYELVRALKCAELQQKGFMIRPNTRVYHMCSDIIAISAYQKAVKVQQDKLNPIKIEQKGFKFPWQKKK